MPAMSRQQPEGTRFAVIDTETTGFSKSDRIVEFACLTVVGDEVVDEYETLIQPNRDPGPVHVHGITPSMLQSAPDFQAVFADIAARLHGAVLVAHNISFDLRMIVQEVDRLGRSLFDPGQGVCTYKLTGKKLALAARDAGLDLPQHTALGDARVSAGLLLNHREMASASSLRPATCRAPGSSSGLTVRRPDSPPRAGSLHNLALSADWPMNIVKEEALYLDVLDRCLDDGVLENHEVLWLDATADALRISEAARVKLHAHYYELLKAQILADGIVTAEEAEMSQLVAKALALVPHEFEAALGSQGSPSLLPGSRVCFTGEAIVNGERVDRATLERAAAASGFSPVSSVTKKCDLLVASDSLSQSSKANYARKLGIPIMGVEEFLLEIGRQY